MILLLFSHKENHERYELKTGKASDIMNFKKNKTFRCHGCRKKTFRFCEFRKRNVQHFVYSDINLFNNVSLGKKVFDIFSFSKNFKRKRKLGRKKRPSFFQIQIENRRPSSILMCKGRKLQKFRKTNQYCVLIFGEKKKL